MGQSLSALISSSFQNSSTCGGSHSLTESVYFALLSFLGLVGSFHNISPDLFFSYFWLRYASYPIITLLIITQFYDFRQAILLAFSLCPRFFTHFFLLLCGIARSNGQYEVLKTLVLLIFDSERGYRGIERK